MPTLIHKSKTSTVTKTKKKKKKKAKSPMNNKRPKTSAGLPLKGPDSARGNANYQPLIAEPKIEAFVRKQSQTLSGNDSREIARLDLQPTIQVVD